MKNLLERIKPEMLQLVEEDSTSYPILAHEIKQELIGLNWVNDIRYRFVIELEDYYRRAFGKIPSTIWECFNEM